MDNFLFMSKCSVLGRSEVILALTLNGHIKTAEQRTIMQQYGDWYTGRRPVGCYI